MSSSQIIKSLIELVMVVFAIWAVFHEDMFIAFEQRLIVNRKRKQLKLIKTIKNNID